MMQAPRINQRLARPKPDPFALSGFGMRMTKTDREIQAMASFSLLLYLTCGPQQLKGYSWGRLLQPPYLFTAEESYHANAIQRTRRRSAR